MLSPSTFLPLVILATIFTTPVLSQTRNLVYPTSTTPTAVATSTTPVSASGATPHPVVNGPAINGTTANNATGVGAAASAPSTTSTIPLSKIPDSTGVQNVPVPVMTGQRANGRYGPDDGYVAAVGHLVIPISLTSSVIVVSMFVVGFGV